MNRQTSQEQLDDLMSQEISDSELQELLVRLGDIEFAWNPKTTIADVVEATSAEPTLIGRLLADIRKEDWEERFVLRVDEHEERIERIEEEQRITRRLLGLAQRIKKPPKIVPDPISGLESTSDKLEPEEYFESDVAEQMRTVGKILALAIAFLIFVAITIALFRSMNFGQSPVVPTGWH